MNLVISKCVTAVKVSNFSGLISVTVQLWIQVFWVISVQFNVRNTLPKFCPFLLGHPVYSAHMIPNFHCQIIGLCKNIDTPLLCGVRYIERNILMRSLLFWDLTNRRLLVSYRHFGTTYGSHFQRRSIQRRLLKTGPIGCSETSVTTKLRCVKSL